MNAVVSKELSAHIAQTLRSLGITRSMKAYGVLTDCILRILEQEDRLEAVQKEVYEPLAELRCCDWKAIQSAIRRAAQTAWSTNPSRVQKLAGYPLDGCPSAVQFLEMLYNDLARNSV